MVVTSFACSEGSGLILPKSTKMIYSGVNLTTDEQEKIRGLFSTMKATRKEIYKKSDDHLLCFIHGQKNPKAFAVFLKDGLIYEGYFQDAWTERMRGDKSTCYKMDKSLKNFFKLLLLRKKDELRN